MARGEDGKVLAQCSENQAGECTLLYRGGDGNGQRTELAWAAEAVGGWTQGQTLSSAYLP